MEVETFARMQSRRPLFFCPCWSPEGNITLPPLLPIVPGLPWQLSSPAVTGLSPCTVSYYPPPHWLCAIQLSRFPQNSAKSPPPTESLYHNLWCLSNYLNIIASCRLIITLAFSIVQPGWKVESFAPGNASPCCFMSRAGWHPPNVRSSMTWPQSHAGFLPGNLGGPCKLWMLPLARSRSSRLVKFSDTGNCSMYGRGKKTCYSLYILYFGKVLLRRSVFLEMGKLLCSPACH